MRTALTAVVVAIITFSILSIASGPGLAIEVPDPGVSPRSFLPAVINNLNDDATPTPTPTNTPTPTATPISYPGP